MVRVSARRAWKRYLALPPCLILELPGSSGRRAFNPFQNQLIPAQFLIDTRSYSRSDQRNPSGLRAGLFSNLDRRYKTFPRDKNAIQAHAGVYAEACGYHIHNNG